MADRQDECAPEIAALARIEAIEEIRQLKARYFRCMDTKAWDELATVFAPDFQVISPDGSVWMEGGAAFAASLRSSLEHSVSAHQGFTSEVTLIDADHATGIWAMQDILDWPGEHAHPRMGWKHLVGTGHYRDSFRRDDGVWRMTSLSLVRTSLETR